MKKTLFIILPCYNEEAVLMHSANILIKKIDDLINKNMITNKSKILFVDDGSTDSTWELIRKLNKKNEKFTGISLSSNRGHQNAQIAGILAAKNMADISIVMDVDLQDDINSIDEMIEKNLIGFDVVYGIRKNRNSDSFFKRNSAKIYYSTLSFFCGKKIKNHASFQLLSKKIVESLSKFKETDLYLRGLVPLIGFKSTHVSYDRKKRMAGNSKYPIIKMIELALTGITSTSIKPLILILVAGSSIFLCSLFFLIVCIVINLIKKIDLNFLSIFSSIWMSCGLILASIGLVGVYSGKTLIESKKRPRFFIKESLLENNLNDKD